MELMGSAMWLRLLRAGCAMSSNQVRIFLTLLRKLYRLRVTLSLEHLHQRARPLDLPQHPQPLSLHRHRKRLPPRVYLHHEVSLPPNPITTGIVHSSPPARTGQKEIPQNPFTAAVCWVRVQVARFH
ncbi:hypothetical protein FGO68_gene17588 [Halteria grandinella]|uniref:Uncharacterized protein n=1 Tax=Halteria grandinella TaxID=5974 RepID=A0A8J8T3A0_HALGN|nr:hypothetical protein FGO68_gene17588 [Halteria grandinella]